MGTQPESKLSREIMYALRARGIWCFKVHGGPMTMAGVPDIIACVPVRCCESPTTTGIFVGFETKTPTGGDPSPIQDLRHNEIRAACGHVCVPRSVRHAVAFIESLGYVDPRASDDGASPTI